MKMTNADKALEFIADGMTVGLGSGSASEHFIAALGERVRAGLRIRGVPTSNHSADLAEKAGIPLVSLEEGLPLDLTVDGADEVDPNFNLIKGYGRALVREKVVAASSKMLVILVGPEHIEEKLVKVLGGRGRLPVEVIPFALPLCKRRIQELGLASQLFMQGDKPFVTDNGNYILDCVVREIKDPAGLENDLKSIPGVVGTGLFVGMADAIVIQRGDKLDVRRRTGT
ncbi:MAG: ribose-5-phosphate isomerase RpiA [Planctomycetes bacterium]|nr:ribose-5-phosphate isomerase RpiA [Planctomycetota bacterium]